MKEQAKSTAESAIGSKSAPGADLLQMLVDSVRDYAIILLDNDGNVLTWNAAAERLKGWKADEIIGQNFSRFYPPEDVQKGKTTMELEVAGAEGRFEDEGWRVRKDGTRFWANVIITALRDKDGQLRGFGKVTRDARKQTDGLGESSCRRRSGPLWPSGGHRARDGNDL